MQETYNLHQEFITRVNGTYKINLKCSRIHLASRGFKDSIGDIEYEEGNIRIGLRANGVPANLLIELI